MATRGTKGGALAVPPAVPVEILLAQIPSWPRPVLNRLVDRLLQHLDDLDGDPDLEAGDEPGAPSGWQDGFPGEPEDAEPDDEGDYEGSELVRAPFVALARQRRRPR